MSPAKTTVKSTARSERAKAIMAALPRDPVTGRMLKREAPTAAAAAAAAPAAPAPAVPIVPAGGPASAPPFEQAPRGLRAFRRQRSG